AKIRSGFPAGPDGGPARHSALPSFRGKELHYKISPFDITKPQLHPPSNGPGLEIPVIGARAKTAHSHYGSLPISSPIRCVALSPLPVNIITGISADCRTPSRGS